MKWLRLPVLLFLHGRDASPLQCYLPPPSIEFAGTIYIPGWREALWELSVLPRNTTQFPDHGSNLDCSIWRWSTYQPWGRRTSMHQTKVWFNFSHTPFNFESENLPENYFIANWCPRHLFKTTCICWGKHWSLITCSYCNLKVCFGCTK